MNNKKHDYIIKIGLIGDSGVGKTCILQQYSSNIFDRISDPTIGVDFVSKLHYINVNNSIKSVKVNIWDTAGQEKYRSISKQYVRNCNCILIVFDALTFNKDNIVDWINTVQNICINAPIILVQNKHDLCTLSDSQTAELNDYIMCKYNVDFMKVSAKTQYNIEELFESAIKLSIPEFYGKHIDRIDIADINLSVIKQE